MIDAPLALAFTAGLVATVNPCGFAMLPAYLGYFMGLRDVEVDAGASHAVRRALLVGAVVSGGFLLVFGLVGVLITLGMRSIVDALPWVAIVVGVGVALLGASMIVGYSPAVSLPRPGSAASGRRHSAVFAFGVSYAIASLSCTLPIFLAVVAGSMSRSSVLSGVAVFMVYGAGMSLVLVVVTIAMALGRQGLIGWLRRSAAWAGRASGVILLLAGGYIVWFWTTNLTDPLSAPSLVTTVERWSSDLSRLIGDRPLLWGGVLGVVAVVAVAYVVTSGRDSARR